MGIQFNDYPELSGFPADNDTYLVYDTSAGSIKQVESTKISNTVDGRRFFVQSTEPTDEESNTGDIWIDIS